MKNSKLTKKQRLAMMLKLLAHESAWNENYDEVVLNLKWKNDEKDECSFWIKSVMLDHLFSYGKATGITVVFYAHQNHQTFKELTGKDPKEFWNQYVAVGTL